ncbi:unnamed protein product [Pleuronectes platessa]|uniref:Uncharacterized protein n=1 Tax=Pleuronectes platessa TaxID=8262 RepID=A0A9N7UKA4_PLEPL|nr:unnamed protein product [Pleuronectes platessa]
MRNIPLSRDEGQCAAVMRGVRKFTKLPTLPYTRGPWHREKQCPPNGCGRSGETIVEGPGSEKVPPESVIVWGSLPQPSLVSPRHKASLRATTMSIFVEQRYYPHKLL